MQRDISARPAKDRNGKAGRFAVGAGFKAPPYGQRIEHQHAPLHLQQALDQALGREGLATALLAENGNVGIEGFVGDRMRLDPAHHVGSLLHSKRLCQF
jgi:hypothetical protein